MIESRRSVRYRKLVLDGNQNRDAPRSAEAGYRRDASIRAKVRYLDEIDDVDRMAEQGLDGLGQCCGNAANAGGIVEVGVFDLAAEVRQKCASEKTAKRMSGHGEAGAERPVRQPALYLGFEACVLSLMCGSSENGDIDNVGPDIRQALCASHSEVTPARCDLLEDGD